MGRNIINVRFGSWHFQINCFRPFVRLSRNPYHDEARVSDPKWRWFEIY